MADIIINKVKKYLFEKEKLESALKQKERKDIILKLRTLSMVWKKYKLEKVYLYGSFTDMNFHKYSDIDIAIEPEIDFEKQLRLYCEINRHIKREVDVRLLKELPFAAKVEKEGIIVYERENNYT